MKIPVFATEEQLDATFKVLKYDVVKDSYIELRGETYLSLNDAKKRAKELNEDAEPIKI